ncbi:unnamed protein product [Moneuplotes crassus]|uniref:Uncharacterized protein n=1 Tax=Euplotes crassus TaxID=5936 RepID=A0AAD2D1R4_EUPCR|nr:unnamed protein product [Moneuplotes crassus]
MPELMSMVFLFLRIPSFNIKYLRPKDSLPSSSSEDPVNLPTSSSLVGDFATRMSEFEGQVLNGECHCVFEMSALKSTLAFVAVAMNSLQWRQNKQNLAKTCLLFVCEITRNQAMSKYSGQKCRREEHEEQTSQK